jgi:hypothetical protein
MNFVLFLRSKLIHLLRSATMAAIVQAEVPTAPVSADAELQRTCMF